MNSEESNIAIETLKLAQSLATLPATKWDIGRAIEWAEKMAKNEAKYTEFSEWCKQNIDNPDVFTKT